MEISDVASIAQVIVGIASLYIAFKVFTFNKKVDYAEYISLSLKKCEEFLYSVLLPMESLFSLEELKQLWEDLEDEDVRMEDIKNYYEYREYIIKIDTFCSCIKSDNNKEGIYDKQIFEKICRKTLARLMPDIVKFVCHKRLNTEGETALIEYINLILFKDVFKDEFPGYIEDFYRKVDKMIKNNKDILDNSKITVRDRDVISNHYYKTFTFYQKNKMIQKEWVNEESIKYMEMLKKEGK